MVRMCKTGIENLKNAIVERAFDDYMAAIEGKKVADKKPKWVIEECETFFKSDWCKSLTNGIIDPDVFVREAHNRLIEKYEAEIADLKNKIKKIEEGREKRLSLM